MYIYNVRYLHVTLHFLNLEALYVYSDNYMRKRQFKLINKVFYGYNVNLITYSSDIL